MEEINRIRLELAKANDANENTNNSGKDYMTIRDSLTDISLLLCRVERAVGECPNENSGLNIPVVMPRFDSPKNWTEDYELENGNYICRCSLCKEHFYGYKRRVICKECAKEHNVNGA